MVASHRGVMSMSMALHEYGKFAQAFGHGHMVAWVSGVGLTWDTDFICMGTMDREGMDPSWWNFYGETM